MILTNKMLLKIIHQIYHLTDLHVLDKHQTITNHLSLVKKLSTQFFKSVQTKKFSTRVLNIEAFNVHKFYNESTSALRLEIFNLFFI